MNEDKQKRLDELRKQNFLSDQENEEISKLKEEENLTTQESIIPKIIEPSNEEMKKPKKRSVLEIILHKIKKKPITWQEIERLQNERKAAYLKRDIAKANYERKNLKTGFFGSNNKSKKGKGHKTSIKRESEPSNDTALRKMAGDNNPNKYKGLTR